MLFLYRFLAAIEETPLFPKEETPPLDFGAAFIKMFLSLIALITLLLISYWSIKKILQKRLGQWAGQKSIHVLEKKMISPKTMLYIVEVDGKKVLLAESHLEIKKIDSLSHPQSIP